MRLFGEIFARPRNMLRSDGPLVHDVYRRADHP